MKTGLQTLSTKVGITNPLPNHPKHQHHTAIVLRNANPSPKTLAYVFPDRPPPSLERKISLIHSTQRLPHIKPLTAPSAPAFTQSIRGTITDAAVIHLVRRNTVMSRLDHVGACQLGGFDSTCRCVCVWGGCDIMLTSVSFFSPFHLVFFLSLSLSLLGLEGTKERGKPPTEVLG